MTDCISGDFFSESLAAAAATRRCVVAQLEMLGLEAERAGHATTAGVQNVELDSGRLAQSGDRGSLRAHSFLVAMPMIDARPPIWFQFEPTCSASA